MTEVRKRTIVIASVLKPVDDTRMFEKMGLSLSETQQYDIHIIGFPARFENMPMIHFHALKSFKRLSLKRITTPWAVFRKILKIKPDVLIITTHELIYQAVLARLFVRTKIIYDIQENYFRNIIYTSAYPGLVRALLAAYVRGKEYVASLFFHHFLLAEKAYAHEFSFTRHRHTVLENKLKKPLINVPRGKIGNQPIALLFSGTLSESTGIFLAIELAVKLHAMDSSVSLTIIGYCAKKKLLDKIRNTIEPYKFIKLIGGDTLVPHVQIIEAIKSSTAGIISYPFNKSTYNCNPTKLYEYLGYRLPIVLIKHPAWASLCKEFNAAVEFDPRHIHAAEIIVDLRNTKFYSVEPQNVYWESEQAKLTRILQFMLA